MDEFLSYNQAVLGRLTFLLFFALPLGAQVISTVVGNALNDNQAATVTTLVRPASVVVDAQGNIFVADAGNFVVRKVDARTGVAKIVAGGGVLTEALFPVRGTSAALDAPGGLATDADGNLYFVESRRHRVRRLAPDGTLTTVAGTSDCQGPPSDNVPATSTDICNPYAVALDRFGNLFIGGQAIVFRVDGKTKLIRRIAGAADGSRGSSGDGGPALDARLDIVFSLAVDGQGSIYVGDGYNNRVRRIDADTGIIRTVAGGGTAQNLGDGGPATSAQMGPPYGLALDAAGNLLIADGDNRRIRRVDAKTGIITTVAGGGPFSNFRRDNILATSAFLGYPVSVGLDAAGNLYLPEAETGLVRRVDPVSNLITTAVGTSSVGDGGPAVSAPLQVPRNIALDAAGNLYIADAGQQRVRRFEAATGRISTVAGTGIYGSSGDGGPGTDAELAVPSGVFVAANGDVFIADTENCRIRRVRSGTITTVAGTNCGFSGDGGPAISAQLSNPSAIIGNAAGTLFIADSNNNRVRAVDSSGMIRTLAADLAQPRGLSLDASGNLLVANTAAHTVLRVNPATGAVTVLAGMRDNCGSGGDGGPATQAQLCNPGAVAADRSGNLYIADISNEVVRKVAPDGTITIFAGTRGDSGFSGDGNLATRARLSEPEGVAADAAGNVFIGDTQNSRVRKVTVSQLTPVPALSVVPPSLTFNVPAGGQPTPQSLVISNINAGSMDWTASVSTASGGGWLSVLPLSGTASPSSTVTVAVNTSGLQAGTYQGTITVTATNATGSPATVPVTLTLGENAVARPGVSAQFLRFFAIQGDPAPPAQALAITSPGSGTLNWAASATTSDGGNWLSPSPASGTAPSTLAVAVAPTGLAPSAYLGLISVRNTASSEVFPVAVSLVVAAPASVLLPSQTSFVFNVVQGATAPAPQTLSIFNAGQGTMSWSIQTSIPAGGNWLTVTPTSGSSAAGARTATPVSISANPSGLAAGVYGAVLVISSAGATNSPALVTVLLNVRPTGTAPAPVVEPAGLVYVAAGASTAQQQTLRVGSTGGTAMPFSVTARTTDGLAWLAASPSNGQVSATGEALSITVTVAPGQLPAGVRQGTITITPTGGAPVDVSVLFVVTPVAGPAHKGQRAAVTCAPTRQFLTPLGRVTNNFSLLVGWPTPLLARATDDCGSEVTAATVVAGFSTETTTVVLTNLRNGQYSGTWTPRSAAAAVTVNMKALAPPLPEANLSLAGALRTETLIPVVPPNAAVNGASFAKLTADGPPAPLTPGSIFSLFGSNLATGTGGAASLPLPRTLLDAQVKIGGLDAPLFFVSSGQINAQVPWELAGRSTASIAVSVKGAFSGTETVTLSAQQPGIFSTASSGAGQGAILDAQFRLVGSSNPARAGDVIQIFATGLGPTTPTVVTGEAAPSSPLANVNAPVQCRIGNASAEVLFAGLAPGFVGLYQVNARIPTGTAAGGAVPVVISVGTATSNTVTIAVQ